MSLFLSPGERAFLESLRPEERRLIEELMVQLDARMLDVAEPLRALREGEDPYQLFLDAGGGSTTRALQALGKKPPLQFEL